MTRATEFIVEVNSASREDGTLILSMNDKKAFYLHWFLRRLWMMRHFVVHFIFLFFTKLVYTWTFSWYLSCLVAAVCLHADRFLIVKHKRCVSVQWLDCLWNCVSSETIGLELLQGETDRHRFVRVRPNRGKLLAKWTASQIDINFLHLNNKLLIQFDVSNISLKT